MVGDYEATSGETHAEFAACHRMEKTTFERWLYLLRGERREQDIQDRVRLLPVRVAVGRSEQHVLVELDSGLGLRVSAVQTEDVTHRAPEEERRCPKCG